MGFLNERKKANMIKSIWRGVGFIIICLVIGLIIPENVKAVEYVKGTVTVSTNSDTLNVRSGPGKEYDVIGKAKNGQQFDASEIQDNWIKIDYDGKEGYVSLDFVDFEPDEEEIVEDDSFNDAQGDAGINDDGELEEEEQGPGLEKYKLIFGLLGAIVVVMIVILLTVKSIKDMDDDDDDDDDYDDDDEYDDDEYEEDEYEEDDEVDYDEDDEVEYEDDDDEYEYEHIVVRRPRESTKKSSVESEDFSINIDPRYFD